MAHLDRIRAAALMDRAGLDALVLLSPEGFSHASGAAPGVGTMWRRAGAVAVLVPADPGVPEAAVVSDLFAPAFARVSHIADIRLSALWVETVTLPGGAGPSDLAAAWRTEGRGQGFSRPTTFDAGVCWRHLAQALADRGLARGRIGVELAAISAQDWPDLAAALGTARLVDATELVARLRMVKTPAEVTLLRQAVGLSEVGIAAVRDAVAPGVSRDDLSAVWAAAVQAGRGGAPLTGAWDYISVGANPWGGNAVARRGDIVKVDAGCLMAGYSSDSARCFAVGAASDAQRQVYAALETGFVAGMGMMGPGVALADVHRVTEAAIRRAGLDGFSRGHYGHSLGPGPGTEEWPFIAADSPVVAEAGMVLAFECPFYVNGLGGFIIENQVLVTADGVDTMNTLPTGLAVLG